MAPFMIDPYKDQKTGSQADGQAGDVDDGVAFVAQDIAHGCF